MPTIHRTPESRLDYEEIWQFIAPENLPAADRLLLQLDATLQTLAQAPMLGRRVEELSQNLRSFPHGSYLIFYRPAPDGIELIRVLHGARDITPEYFREE